MNVRAQVRAAARRASAPPAARWLSIARAGYGVVLLTVPGALTAAVTGGPVSARVRAVARVLGARQVAQATVCGLLPESRLLRAGSAADGLHAVSMLTLAVAEPRLRRALLAETAIAAALASGSAAAAALASLQARDLTQARG